MRYLQFAISILAGLIVEATASPTPPVLHNPTVTVRNGTLAGVRNTAFDQDFFLGIPYATPPIHEHRLKRPKPPQAWNGTRIANAYGPSCAGNPFSLPGFTQSFDGSTSEDCLQLNIVRPATLLSNHTKLPVLVWFHGGGWVTGSAVDPRYNGSFLVQNSVRMGTPIIFVSANFRLGTFGFLAGSVIEKAGLTNNGLRDQRQALHWIQENIVSFGGDRDRVTLFGESAGAGMIAQQLIAFGGRDDNIFHQAIMESGTAATAAPYLDSQEREKRFQQLANATGCASSLDVLTCLQAVSTESLSLANPTRPPLLTVNDDFFPELPSKLLDEGRFLHVPIIVGTNRNEGTTILSSLLTTLKTPINNFKDFTAYYSDRGYPLPALKKLWDIYGDEISNPTEAGLGVVSPTQKSPELGSEFARASLWAGDSGFTFSRRLMNQVWNAAGVASYSYFFDIVPAESFLDPSTYGVAHFSEIPYVFGNAEAVGWEKNPIPQGPDKADYLKIVELMSRMWISFTVSGSPNNHKSEYTPLFIFIHSSSVFFIQISILPMYVVELLFCFRQRTFTNQCHSSRGRL